jgi:hypothetical protein
VSFLPNREKVISAKDTEMLMSTLWHPTVKDDLYKFVMFSYPWGEKNTPLENALGPRIWQRDQLNRMTDAIGKNKLALAKGDPPEVYRLAVCSGRGPGKSAFLSWCAHWMMSCQLGSSTVVTANTAAQLVAKTFAEIGTWSSMFIANYWFERNQTKVTPAPWFADAVNKARKIDSQYYYIDGVLWNEDNPHAFAGVHNPRGMMLLFDEASGIPEPIWTVSSGFFTDLSPYRFWFVFSNGRANTGAFYECFNGQARDLWNGIQIDARTVEGLDKKVFEGIIQQYGEDSDEARVEVKGEFPKQGENQFISRGVVQEAQKRVLERYDDHAALLMGVDPARFGNDSTVISFRRGRDARSIPQVVLKGLDNMAVANKCAELIDLYQPDGVFIDAGAGAGIIDRLKERGYRRIFEVWFGSASSTPEYADHRTELWGKMREWLSGALLPEDRFLENDLCGPRYEFSGREDKIRLESKEKMKTRALASPDRADSLACTFHAKIIRRGAGDSLSGRGIRSRKYKGSDYKVFG